MDTPQLEKALEELTTLCFVTAEEKGWWKEPRTIPELLALIHSEVSEALEAYRDPAMNWTHLDYEGMKPVGLASELADVFIRIFDMAAGYQIPVAQAVTAKMAYNREREYRHGGKRL